MASIEAGRPPLGRAATIVSAAVLLAACSAAPSASSSQATGTTAPTPSRSSPASRLPGATTNPSPSPKPVAHLKWTSASFEPPSGDPVVAVAIRPDPDRLYVAVSYRGRIWRSRDGVAWDTAPSLRFPVQSDYQAVNDATYANGRFVVVGDVSGPNASGSISLAAYTGRGSVVWSSADGTRWAVTGLQTTTGEPIHVRELVPSPDGLVAVAFDYHALAMGIATSADGRDWTFHAVRRGDGDEALTNVVRLEDGSYLATGHFFETWTAACGAGLVGAWRSPDGVSWERSSDALGCFTVGGLLPSGAGAAAIGWDLDPAVWLTADGRAWERVDHPFDVQAGPLGVAPDGTLLAFSEGTIWESLDGRGWAPSIRVSGSLNAAFGGDVAFLGIEEEGSTVLKLQP